jgi:hypothetical protein
VRDYQFYTFSLRSRYRFRLLQRLHCEHNRKRSRIQFSTLPMTNDRAFSISWITTYLFLYLLVYCLFICLFIYCSFIHIFVYLFSFIVYSNLLIYLLIYSYLFNIYIIYFITLNLSLNLFRANCRIRLKTEFSLLKNAMILKAVR